MAAPTGSATLPFSFADKPASSAPKSQPAQQVTPNFITDAIVFENLNNSRTNWVPCLDADSGHIGSNGDLVHVWGCNSTSYQHWKFRAVSGNPYWYTVYNVAGNKCLDADSAGGGQNGNRIQLWSCNGTVYQQWYVWSPNGGDTIYLQNGNGLRYLDAATETAGENNGRVQLWDWNGGRADEQWSTPEP
ncbi:RICIN domain-containing protein [Streptomyces sp. NPDC058086]|uniref:RICIN domain-containing protein n=1 Tax=Streptomyces sp. NPDC058086 TaxID=3346334 RepID=UPI0036EEA660